MKLAEFSVTDFQSFGPRQTLRLDDHITFLAGRNDVGKSAVLRALRTPAASPAPDLRIGLRLEYSWRLPAAAVLQRLPLAARDPEVLSTFAGVGLTTLDATFAAAAQGMHAARLASPELGVVETPSGVNGGWEGGPLDSSTLGVGEVTRFARDLIADILYVGPRRVELDVRTYSPSLQLEADARNLANVLVTIQNSEPDIAAAIRDFLRQAFPQIDRVMVPPLREQNQYAGEPTVYYRGADDRRVPLRLCGTGVEQLLALEWRC